MQTSKLPKQATNNTQRIQMAQDYITQLQLGENQQAENLLQEINQLNTKPSDQDLYSRVGKLTRDLHDSMSSFMNDTRIHMMTNEDMPDARQRLQHVVDLTEQSAHTTMTLIENSNPLLSQLRERATVLQQQLHSYKNKQRVNNTLSNDKPGDAGQERNGSMYLNEEIDAFLHLVSSSSKNITKNLNEIMLAQNYQDLTGQVIQRVSTLVQEVENNLLILLQSGNEQIATEQLDVNIKSKENKNNRGYGPAVPGVSKGDVLHSQEEVDDLLSSLGF